MSIPEGVDRDSMMKQAQNIWTMLDEMAERDPRVLTNFNVSNGFFFWSIVLLK